jgi:uncharacterized protein YuzE
MRFTYDPKYNLAYLKFQEKSAEVQTLKVSDEVTVDLTPDGTIYGIELLNASEHISRRDEGNVPSSPFPVQKIAVTSIIRNRQPEPGNRPLAR